MFKASRGIEGIYKLTYIRKDGRRFPAVVSVTALRDAHNTIIGYLLIGTDNTARKQVEVEQRKLDQRLRDQQFYTRSLIESNIDALMTTDQSGIISDVNKQMEALTGCTLDELIGAPFKNYFTDAERAETGIKRALQETNVALEGARFAAHKSNLAKSDFRSSVSHELRSALNANLGFAHLMESGVPLPTPSQKDSIAQILQAGWYVLELINEILDLSLIGPGKLSLSLESLSMIEVLADRQAMIEPQAQAAGIRTQFPAFDLPYFMRADRTRVKQIVVNLLSNAIKYNRVGGTVEVTCSAATAERTRISFHDTGEGLHPEKIAQLFQPFNRLGQEPGLAQGTGIGLVVSKRLVELMGGEIGVEGTVGVAVCSGSN